MANTDLFFSAFPGGAAPAQPVAQQPVAPTLPAMPGSVNPFAALGAQQQTPSPSLPQGLNIDQLDAESRYNLLLRYPQYYLEQYGDKTTYEKILQEAKKDRDAAITARANLAPYRSGLAQAGVSTRSDENLLDVISSSRGNIDDFFYGTNAEDASFPQRVMRNFLAPETANVSAALSQIVSNQALENYDKLRGAGSISNFEVQMGRSAASSINNRGTAPEEIVRQLRTIQAMVDLGEFRNSNRIRVGDDGREWQWDANNENPQRVITTRNPQTGQIQVIPLADPNIKVISVPFNLNENEFKQNYYDNTENGTIIIFNGQAFTKGGDNDPFVRN